MNFAGYEKGEVFDLIINSKIAGKYDEEKINVKVLNGDGASWISAEAEIDQSIVYQLDLIHIYWKAMKKIKDKEERQEVKKLIREKEWDRLTQKVKELYEKATDDKEKENLKELYTYYENNYIEQLAN